MKQDRVDGIYAYVEIRPDGEEGIIGAVTPLGNFPLVTSQGRILEKFDPIARSHANATGFRVELRHFGGAPSVLREFLPRGGGG